MAGRLGSAAAGGLAGAAIGSVVLVIGTAALEAESYYLQGK